MKAIVTFLLALGSVCVHAASESNYSPLMTRCSTNNKLTGIPQVRVNGTNGRQSARHTARLEDDNTKNSNDNGATAALAQNATAKSTYNATEEQRRESVTLDELEDLIAREIEDYANKGDQQGTVPAQRIKRDGNGGKRKKGGKGKGGKNGKRRKQRKGGKKKRAKGKRQQRQ